MLETMVVLCFGIQAEDTYLFVDRHAWTSEVVIHLTHVKLQASGSLHCLQQMVAAKASASMH